VKNVLILFLLTLSCSASDLVISNGRGDDVIVRLKWYADHGNTATSGFPFYYIPAGQTITLPVPSPKGGDWQAQFVIYKPDLSDTWLGDTFLGQLDDNTGAELFLYSTSSYEVYVRPQNGTPGLVYYGEIFAAGWMFGMLCELFGMMWRNFKRASADMTHD